ncbi:MAG: hypothetical protein Q7S03_02760 [bacterium]|nr:hypothetical protein [bacterium]
MAKHILPIREEDRRFFESLSKGEKTIETRAATEKYRKIKKGDTLVFVCGQDKLGKRVKDTNLFKTIEEIAEVIDLKKIMPFVNSVEEMKEVYFSFPGYKEKISKFGLISFNL